MIEALISSKTRINLLLKFFLNPERTAYLRGLAEEFGESTNSIRLELNKFEKAGMLDTSFSGNRKIFKVNQEHPLFNDIRSIVFKFVGIDKLIEDLVKRLGNLEKVYITGDFAKGKNGDILDILIVGEIDQSYLLRLIEKVEKQIKKRIRYLIYTVEKFKFDYVKNENAVLIWNK